MLPEHGARIIIVAPVGRDAAAMAELLTAEGHEAHVCTTLTQAAGELQAGVGALLLTDDALAAEGLELVLRALEEQPAWSELPVTVLTRGERSPHAELIDRLARAGRSITLLERPLGAVTLARSIDVAMRSRRRQYQVRELLLSQRARERELRASEERLRLAIEGADLGSWDVDLRTGRAVWNRRHGQLLGDPDPEGPHSLEQWQSLVDPRDLEPILQELERARAQRRPFAVEHRLRNGESGPRWLALYGRFTYDEAGEAVRLSGVSRDVTEPKRWEAERERYLGALKAADRRKDDFLATLSHELRNPLAPIRNAAEVLASPHLETHQLRWAQHVIQRQTAHMAWLLDDLLEITRITQGKLLLRRERCSLRAVLDVAIETAGPFLERKSHQLTVRIPEEVPDFMADPLRLAQAVSNLLTNAAKYTGERGRIELWVRLEEALVIGVKDNGIGIPREQLGQLFTMFSQISSSSAHAEGGLGIGLALVKGLVELHGGSVAAYSEGSGLGSEFILRLPFEPAAAAPAKRGVEPAPAPRDKLRVLVADDNQDAADSLSMLLAMDGCEVQTAYGGEAAVSLARLFHPDVALLDIGMPELDGYAAASAIRRQRGGADICLIALTGWGQEEDRRRALGAGFSMHITKPVDPAHLRRLLTEVRSGAATAHAAAP